MDAGAERAADRAHEWVNDTLANYRPSHISPEIDAKIRERFDIRLDL